MPRFVILSHDWPFQHWDFMLESTGKLLTWRILQEPLLDEVLSVTESQEHRIEYLDYVGPVSGNRGSVNQWDCGKIRNIRFDRDDLVAELESLRFGLILEVHINHNRLVLQKKMADPESLP